MQILEKRLRWLRKKIWEVGSDDEGRVSRLIGRVKARLAPGWQVRHDIASRDRKDQLLFRTL